MDDLITTTLKVKLSSTIEQKKTLSPFNKNRVTATVAVNKMESNLIKISITINKKSPSEDQRFYLQENLLKTYCSIILEYQKHCSYPTGQVSFSWYLVGWILHQKGKDMLG